MVIVLFQLVPASPVVEYFLTSFNKRIPRGRTS